MNKFFLNEKIINKIHYNFIFNIKVYQHFSRIIQLLLNQKQLFIFFIKILLIFTTLKRGLEV